MNVSPFAQVITKGIYILIVVIYTHTRTHAPIDANVNNIVPQAQTKK